MASQVSHRYGRQLLHAGDTFNDLGDNEPDTPSSDFYNLELKVSRTPTGRRRVIHVDYDEVFGDFVHPAPDKDKKSTLIQPPVPTRSPEYEQIVYGLTDEAIKFFPPERRGYSRYTSQIVKNLMPEFDLLADESTESEPDTEAKSFLQVPKYTPFSQNEGIRRRDKKNGWDGGKQYSDDGCSNQQFLRRKPIFKRRNSKRGRAEDEDNLNASCSIS